MARHEIEPSRIVIVIIMIVVGFIVLSALANPFMSSVTTFTNTISNYTNLKTLVPLANAVPLLVFLAFLIGFIIAAVYIFKHED